MTEIKLPPLPHLPLNDPAAAYKAVHDYGKQCARAAIEADRQARKVDKAGYTSGPVSDGGFDPRNANDQQVRGKPVEHVVQLEETRCGRVYIAGPMTGIADWNFPAFNAAAAALRAEGMHVENPAEHGIVDGAEWPDYLRYDIAQLATCEALYLLPGWSKSRGAKLEAQIALALGMELRLLNGAEPTSQAGLDAAESAAIEADRKHFAETLSALSGDAAGMYEQECDSYFNGLSDGYDYAAQVLRGEEKSAERKRRGEPVDVPDALRQIAGWMDDGGPSKHEAEIIGMDLSGPVECSSHRAFTKGAKLAFLEAARIWEHAHPAAPQPAEPVAYLDLGVGGYMDVGTDLTDEQLAALPKGRHMLGIIGTYGVDGYREVAPQQQQQAGEPVIQFRKEYCADWYDGYPDHSDGGGPYETRTLYTAPQPLQIPEPAPLRESMSSNHRSYAEGWNACRAAMLKAAPEVEG